MTLLTSLSPFLQPTFANPSHVLLLALLLREGISLFSHQQLTQSNVNVALTRVPVVCVCVEIAMCLGQAVDLSSFFSLVTTYHFSTWFVPSSPLK